MFGLYFLMKTLVEYDHDSGLSQRMEELATLHNDLVSFLERHCSTVRPRLPPGAAPFAALCRRASADRKRRPEASLRGEEWRVGQGAREVRRGGQSAERMGWCRGQRQVFHPRVV